MAAGKDAAARNHGTADRLAVSGASADFNGPWGPFAAPAEAAKRASRAIGWPELADALHELEARLCRWLLQTHDCTDGDIIPLTQESLGKMLGVRRTTVTIAARLLLDAGLIRYRRGHIEIVDRAALEEIACECYGVVRQNADKVFPPASPIKAALIG
jgi:DNA-binding MarR family transcriptional regulator